MSHPARPSSRMAQAPGPRPTLTKTPDDTGHTAGADAAPETPPQPLTTTVLMSAPRSYAAQLISPLTRPAASPPLAPLLALTLVVVEAALRLRVF